MGWNSRLICSFLVLCLFSGGAFAQSPQIKRYTIADGLLTNETYQVYQDSKGYIWIATAFGVNRFNGSHFETIEANNFRNMSVNEVLEDSKHQMWFVTFSGKMFIRKNNGYIVPFAYNKKITDKINSNKGHIKYSFWPLGDSSVLISLKDKGKQYVTKNGSVRVSTFKESTICFDFTHPKTIISSFCRIEPGYGLKIILPKNQELNLRLKVAATHMFALKLANGKRLISTDKYLYVIDGLNYKIYQMPDAITGLFQDRDGKIWVLLNGAGVRSYMDEDFSKKPIFALLDKETVTSIIQDKEGAFWLSTLYSGICYIPSMSVVNYTAAAGLPSDKISRVFCWKGVVWLGYLDAFISSISPDGKMQNFSSASSYSTYVKWIGYSEEEKSILASADQLYKIKNGRVIPLEDMGMIQKGRNRNISLLPRSLTPSKRGGYWVTSNRGIKFIRHRKLIYDSFQSNEFTGVTYSCAEDDRGGVWIASNSLWYFTGGRFVNYGDKYPSLNIDISRVHYDKQLKLLWIATKGNGLFAYDGQRLLHIEESSGIQSGVVTSIAPDGNNLWVGTSRGVDFIRIKKISPLTISVRNFNTTHGLIGNDVKDLCVTRRFVYVATASGLSRIDRYQKMAATPAPTVVISSLHINDKDTTFSHPLQLKHNQNFIDINFNTLTYKRGDGGVKYRYKLEGLSCRWFYTEEERVRFYKLEPGEYRFLVEAKNNDGIWSSTPATINFCIEKPFWTSLWFYGLLLLFFGLVIYGIMRTRIIFLRKLSMYERKGNLWKNQSLSLQMNPHFIFNTLNSIQLFILKCDVDSSLYYLSKFSILMRKTLENSNKIKISLKEELEVLSLYLELEKLRSEDKFTFSINCDENINQSDTCIPTLLIQPFVENSIWHGIMPKSGKGHISVQIVNSGDYIKCCIKDDGIGRIKSLEMKKERNMKGHTSFATRIVSNRMELLKTLYNKEFGLKYTDLYDSEGKAIGTEVVIIIPRDFQMVKEVNLIAE